jgi:Family of unknown function (DUF6535)
VLLNRISYQLSSLGAQYPANLSLPGFIVQPSASDVRVNTYWFVGLVCSLSAALLATLVQRWARDYMHIFHRYSHPLKVARLREFLREGIEHWKMRAIAEAVPGLIHISLFLFFIGLADFLFSTHATMGKIIIVPIAVCAMLYVISSIAPVIFPQSPYRTSFSSLAWRISRWLFHRSKSFTDRFSGKPKHLSWHMAEGQFQLAMANNEARKDRDEKAIRWLVTNLTGDTEMESLASGIPGSFDAKWGVKVWRGDHRIKDTGTTNISTGTPPAFPSDTLNLLQRLKRTGSSTFGSHLSHAISDPNPNPNPNPNLNLILPISDISPSISDISSRSISDIPRPISDTPRPISDTPRPISDLCQGLGQGIQRLFDTCNYRDSFTSDDEWLRRSRTCAETAASLVFFMGADISAFGNIGRILSDLGSAEKTREVSANSLNWSFISRWTCLSIVVIRKLLDSPNIREFAGGAIFTLGTSYGADMPGNFALAGFSPENARKIDDYMVTAWSCVDSLRGKFKGLSESDRSGGGVEEILLQYKPQLEEIKLGADRTKVVDEQIFKFQKKIDEVTHNLTRVLPGVGFDERTGPKPIGQVFDFLANPSFRPQFLYLSQRLHGLSILSQKRSSMGYVEVAEVLKAVPIPVGSVVGKHRSMERQLWRLQDLSGGGAFGFTLELYLLSLRRIYSTGEPRDNLITFYTGALKTITSDWDRPKQSSGTLQIVLNIVCDIAVRDRGIFSNWPYPAYVEKELLELLGNMVKGHADRSSVDWVMEELQSNDVGWRTYSLGDPSQTFGKKVMDIIQNYRDSDQDS